MNGGFEFAGVPLMLATYEFSLLSGNNFNSLRSKREHLIGEEMNNEPIIPAAQYVRMSTEHQQFSLTNQKAAIHAYACAHNFVIVQTYSDAARSGILLRNRDGLKRLLGDVVHNPIFHAVLVYDVSRWGRFQDVDESAHYEFLCKSAGVPVHYCAEQFTNEQTISNALLKSLKRAMAAEYSRELGVKVYNGQSRLVRLGFKMGGAPPLGLRRMLVSSDGSPKHLLGEGERKSIDSDRVVMVPGPADEIQLVREIFRLAIEEKLRPEAIAKRMNSQGVRFSSKRSDWERQNVENILKNPLYTGCNTWGRTASRLHSGVRRIAESGWVMKKGAFAEIVSQDTFSEAQRALVWKRTDEELLEGLKRTWETEGAVTQEILSRSSNFPNYSTCCSHFGTLKNALALIGYEHKKNYQAARERSNAFQKLHRGMIKKLNLLFPHRLAVLCKPFSPRRLLRLDGNLDISIQIAVPRATAGGNYSWRVQPRGSEKECLIFCCYLSIDHKRIESMYFIKKFSGALKSYTVDPESNNPRHYKLTFLKSFCSLARKVATYN